MKNSFSEGLTFLAGLGLTTTLTVESDSVSGPQMVVALIEVGVEVDVEEVANKYKLMYQLVRIWVDYQKLWWLV